MEQKTTLCPYLGRPGAAFFQLDRKNPKHLKVPKNGGFPEPYKAILGVDFPLLISLTRYWYGWGVVGFETSFVTPHHLEIAPPKVQNYHKKAPSPSVVLLI